MEIWKDVVGYEDYYMVSNTGKVFSKRKNKILKQALKRNGYLSVDLVSVNKRTVSVHRIVAEAFIPNMFNYPVVNHKDENKFNNNANNLEWCTQKYNANYGNNHLVKNSKVIQMDLNGNYIKLWESMKMAEEELNIRYQTISAVCRGKKKSAGGYKWKYAKTA